MGDMLKEICEKKGYSAFSIGNFQHAALKRFGAPITVDDCLPSRGYTNSIYIFHPTEQRTLSEPPAPFEPTEAQLAQEEEENLDDNVESMSGKRQKPQRAKAKGGKGEEVPEMV